MIPIGAAIEKNMEKIREYLAAMKPPRTLFDQIGCAKAR